MRIAVLIVALAVSPVMSVANAQAQENSANCTKPWAIPDRWIDNHDETEPIDQIWTPDDTFETVDAQGNPLPDADVYMAPNPNDPGTGFNLSADLGRALTVKTGDASLGMRPGWFFAVETGTAGGGGNAYRTAIGTCDVALVQVGDTLPLLMGKLHGPTVQGVADLLALDPTAYWNVATNTIVDSCASGSTPCGAVSPRVGLISVFDPAVFEQTKSDPSGPQLIVRNQFGVFIEGVVDGNVKARLVSVPALAPEGPSGNN